MEKPSKCPLILGHRGASAHAPENTLPAFQLAVDQGADGIELDVMLSKDKRLIVIHDHTLERTTNGTGKVPEHNYEQLKDLDAGLWFGEHFQNTRLPLLDEVYEQLGGKCLINVELKNYHQPGDALPDIALALTKKYDLLDSVLFSSFNARNIVRLKKAEPKAKTGLLCLPKLAGAFFRGPIGYLFGYDALHPYKADVSKTSVKRAHKRGKAINVWTVNNAEDLHRLISLGVDAIITDDPRHALQIRDEQNAP